MGSEVNPSEVIKTHMKLQLNWAGVVKVPKAEGEPAIHN